MSNFNVFEKIVSEIKKDKKEKFGGKTMSKIKVQPTITESTASYYREAFKKPASAMADILENVRDYADGNPTSRMFENPLDMLNWTLETNKAMQRYAKRALECVFIKSELLALVNVMKNCKIAKTMPGDTILCNAENLTFTEMNRPAQDLMIKKVRSLGFFERSYLELWAWSFWYAPGFDDRDLESYIQQLL